MADTQQREATDAEVAEHHERIGRAAIEGEVDAEVRLSDEEILVAGAASTRKRTQNITARIRRDLATVRTYVEGEQRVAALEAQLATARRELNAVRADDPGDGDA